jgi:hypothetical protein
MAVEKRTPREVVPERLVLSRVAPESAVETMLETEVAEDSAPEAIDESEVWIERPTLELPESADATVPPTAI